jgi:hypothetical protein
MNKKLILQKIAELVNVKFASNDAKPHQFAMVELEGGVIVSNQTEDDLVVGDTIYVVNEDGTYSIVSDGTWTYLDGSKTLITNTEGELTEIRSNEGEDVEAEKHDKDKMEKEKMDEEVVEVPEEIAEVVDADVIEGILEALAPIVDEIKQVQEEVMKLKKDYMSFKKSAEHTPFKEDKVVSKAFSTDTRYEMLKAMKELNKK